MPKNVILGATIETDDDELYKLYDISRAPPPSERTEAMKKLQWKLKFISIEPILDFTDDFLDAIKDIKPFMVYIGYDNYNNKLPEPSMEKTKRLIAKLRELPILVIKKNIRPAWYEKQAISRYAGT